MGVFNKLKEVLFDVEEEEEIPVITKNEVRTREPLKEENTIKEVKMPKEDFLDELPLREEVDDIPKPKKESNFNFPLDFEEEIPMRSKRNLFDDEFTSRTTIRETRREEPKRREEYDYDYSRLDVKEVKKEEPKNFKPSPVISPVYGILDQNYTKDDVIVRNDGSKRKPNLDDVRKKAYSKKKTGEEKDEFEEPLKTLDEILIDKDEEIPKTKKKVEKKEEEVILDETLPIGVYDDELPDEPYADEVGEEELLEEEPKVSKEDELESDLFNLIDSMYEDKNEREDE